MSTHYTGTEVYRIYTHIQDVQKMYSIQDTQGDAYINTESSGTEYMLYRIQSTRGQRIQDTKDRT